MKHYYLLFITTLAACLLTACSPDPVDTTGSISGTISDAISNAPLTGATVTLSPSGRSTTTGTDGQYQFSNVEQGSYNVSVSRADYVADSKPATVVAGQNTPLDFTLRRAGSALTVSPLLLDFGETDTSLSIDIKNGGQATMSWQIAENIAWLSCSQTSGTVSAGQQTSVAITVDRTGLSRANYTNTLVVTSGDGGSQSVRVNMSVTGAEASLPQVSMLGVGGISDNSASFSGAIIRTGTSRVTQHGFCWSTLEQPTLQQGQHCQLGEATQPKDISFIATGLAASTTYYVRAYATNAEGTFYSSAQERFTTLATAQRPEVETGAALQVNTTQATVSATIKSLGHQEGIVEHGHVWSSQTQQPTTDHARTTLGATKSTGSYTSRLEGLSPGTTYYVRAYARNQFGTSYGNAITLVTPPDVVSLTTTAATNITHNQATLGGSISDTGGNVITERGICWATTPNPIRAGSHQAAESADSRFSVRISGLTPLTAYHVRAYVSTKSGEVYYGNDITFSTTYEILTGQVEKPAVGSLTPTGATFSSRIVSDGKGTVSDCGFVYARTPMPTIGQATQVSCGRQTGAFSKAVGGLRDNTTYYVRAYVTNEAGTAYSDETNFATPEVTVPALSTVTVSKLTYRTASFAATVTSRGNGTLTDAGFVYSTQPNPTLANNKLSCGTTTTLSARAAGLSPSTTYYVRAYATNEKGTAYSGQQTFTTNSEPAPTSFGKHEFSNEQDW